MVENTARNTILRFSLWTRTEKHSKSSILNESQRLKLNLTFRQIIFHLGP